jgi:phosphoribosylglycinamide formyltransferase-1
LSLYCNEKKLVYNLKKWLFLHQGILIHLYIMFHHFNSSTSNIKRTKIAIFASGAGSNANKIIKHLQQHASISVGLIVCNNPLAGVLQVAEVNKIPVLLIQKEQFFRGNAYVEELREAGVDFIVLAGFLWKIPALLIENYRNRIINIHPALLPDFGGKGMYGSKVHEAVIASNAKESGITIHFVDEHYDNGDIIFQEKCKVYPDDSADTLAERIHKLEHENFPRVVVECIHKLQS